MTLNKLILAGKLKPCDNQVFDFKGISKVDEYVVSGRKRGGDVCGVKSGLLLC